MDENTWAVLERIEKLRSEVKEDIHSAIYPLKTRVENLEGWQIKREAMINKLFGMALLAGGLGSFIMSLILKHV